MTVAKLKNQTSRSDPKLIDLLEASVLTKMYDWMLFFFCTSYQLGSSLSYKQVCQMEKLCISVGLLSTSQRVVNHRLEKWHNPHTERNHQIKAWDDVK